MTTTATTSLGTTPLLVSTFTFPNSLAAPNNVRKPVTFDAWTPMVSLSYKPTENTMVYASASRGFKSGGFNGRANSLADLTQSVDGSNVLVTTFKPETVWTYEVGAKGTFLDGRVADRGRWRWTFD